MVDSIESLEDKIATREHIVSDQGNGASYCSNCDYNFGSDFSKKYEVCPGCDYKLVPGKIHINRGGSDF